MNVLAIIVMATLVFVGLRSSRRHKLNFSDLIVADRSVGAVALTASLLATYIGPGLSLGLIEQSFEHGWLGALLPLGYMGQLVAVAWVFAPIIRRRFGQAATLGDIFVLSTQEPSSVFIKLSGGFSVLIMTGVCAIMSLIGGQAAAAIFGTSPLVGSAIMTLVVALYTCGGGLRASIRTDLLQFGLFALILSVLLGALVLSTAASAPLPPTFAPPMTSSAIISAIVAFAIGDMLQPPFVQRILSARSPSVIRRAYAATAVLLALWFLSMGFIGILGRKLIQNNVTADALLPTIAAQVLPAGWSLLIPIAVLMIVMSSQDSILNAAASVAVRDLLDGQENLVALHRGATLLIALAGFVLSQAFTSLMGGILFLASLWAPAMVVPILAAILTRQRTHIPALCAQITGFGLSLSWSVLGTPGGIPAIVVGLTASAAAFLIASAIAKRFQQIPPDPIKNRG